MWAPWSTPECAECFDAADAYHNGWPLCHMHYQVAVEIDRARLIREVGAELAAELDADGDEDEEGDD